MRVETFPTREAWLLARRKGVGASEAATVLGRGYGGPFSLWSKKVGLIPDDFDPDIAYWSAIDEPAVLRRLGEEAGVNIVHTPLTICWSEEYPGLFCSPDGVVACAHREPQYCGWNCPDRVAGAEAKSLDPFALDDWQESVPEHYLDQLQASMLVTGLPCWYIGARIGRRFKWARVEADPEWREANLPALLEFVRRIREEDPPPPDGSDADEDALGARFPKDNGTTIALPGSFIALTDEYEYARDEADEALFATAEIRNKVRAALGDATCGVLVDGRKWTWKADKRGVRALRLVKTEEETPNV